MIEKIFVKDLDIEKVTLKNDKATVVLLSYGAGVYQYQYEKADLIIVPKTIEAYTDDMTYYGKTIGRTSGRLVVPSYQIDHQSYKVEPYRSTYTSLHGGKSGFSTKNFELIHHEKQSATFRYVSKDLEEGYPGQLTLDVTYELKPNGSLQIAYKASTTKDTLCNITNHVYFNLNQKQKTIDQQWIQLKASKYLEIDDNYLIKEIKNVQDTPFDLTDFSPFSNHLELMKDSSFQGFDHTFIFDDNDIHIPKAIAYDPISNIGINCYTTYPAVVLYTHNNPAGIPLKGSFDQDAIHSSFTLECQFEPGGIHHPYLNQSILKKDDIYKHLIIFEPFRK